MQRATSGSVVDATAFMSPPPWSGATPRCSRTGAGSWDENPSHAHPQQGLPGRRLEQVAAHSVHRERSAEEGAVGAGPHVEPQAIAEGEGAARGDAARQDGAPG